MEKYWNNVWDAPDIEKYIGYVKSYVAWKPEFLEIFAKHNVKNVCDAACGFGAYSVMMSKRGYLVSGFDISENSVNLTRRMVQEFGLSCGKYEVCEITDIRYDDATFCAAVAHAVIDHIPLADAKIALAELFRIITPGGLLYLSFDPLGEDDLNNKHKVSDDGSLIYEDGLLFRYYSEKDICLLLDGRKIIYSNTNPRGEREYILLK